MTLAQRLTDRWGTTPLVLGTTCTRTDDVVDTIATHVMALAGLQQRDTNPEFDGLWHTPSGKLDADESVLDAMVREAFEKVGVLIEHADLRHVHTIHVNGSGPEPRLGLFFEARRWHGEPTNREPDKCSAVQWFPLANLPARIIDYPAAGISAYRDGVAFSTRGWSREVEAALV